MPKIRDLPYLSTANIYYDDGIWFAGDGLDANKDYVTGQISCTALTNAYVEQRVGYIPKDHSISESSVMLYKLEQNDDTIIGITLGDMTSKISDYISTNDYLSEYLSEYLSTHLSTYLSEYLSTYMSDYFGSLLPTSPDDIGGVITMSSDYSSLQYIQTSSLHDLICSCIYYDGAYSDTLSDDTYLAGIFDYDDDRRLAYITLGDIVSYIREHL